jgi:predicted phage terminase large subunit-like protein
MSAPVYETALRKRLLAGEKLLAPHPGPQTSFLSCGADEALYGGACGGGKSFAILLDSLRHVHEPTYRALILRRTWPEAKKAIWDDSHAVYPHAGAKPNETDHYWRFPSGAMIWFGSLEHEQDVSQYKSAQFQRISFDEVTTFTERQFVFMFSRLRSAAGIPCGMRAGTNPAEDESGEWVLRRFAPWLYRPGVRTDEYTGPYAAPGEVLWFSPEADDGRKPCSPQTKHAASRAFFPARLADNPSFSDGAYLRELMKLDPVTRAQLIDGDWMMRAKKGELFQRSWCLVVPRGPERAAVVRVRWWDRAATEGEKKASSSGGPDWTVGLLMSKDRDGVIYVEHVDRFRAGPGEVERRIRQRAEQDQIDHGSVRVCLAKDPASAGKFEADHYVRKVLAGFDVHAIAETGDKVTRFKPFSAQCGHGNVRSVRGEWNEAYFAEGESFPAGKKDQMDASSGAYSQVEPAARFGSRRGGPSAYRGAMGGF